MIKISIAAMHRLTVSILDIIDDRISVFSSSQCHQQWVYKGIVGLCIPIIVRVIDIWDEALFEFRVFFNRLVIRNKVFLEYSHCIDTHLDVVVEVLEVNISVAFELWIGEEFIKFWWAYLMFEIPHAINVFRISTFQGWSPLVSWDRSGIILGLWRIHLVRWGIRNLNLIHNIFDHLLELVKLNVLFINFLIRILPVGINRSWNDEELASLIIIHLVLYTWNIGAWCMKGRII